MKDIIKYEISEKTWRGLFQTLKKQRILSINQQKIVFNSFVQVLHQRVWLYNGKRSSSISMLAYKEIQRSMFYVLDHALPNAQQVNFLLTKTIEEQLKIGEGVIEAQLATITKLWKCCIARKLMFRNERYQSILYEQLPTFMNQYDVTFSAHRCYEDLDYPLIDGIPMDHQMYHKKGSDLVYEYMLRFDIEQQYAIQFQSQLPQIIDRYEQLHGISITYLGLNVCSLLIPMQYCSMILPKDSHLCFTNHQFTYITKHLDQLKSVGLLKIKALMDPIIYEYMEDKLIDVKASIVSASQRTLTYLLLCEPIQNKNVFIIPPAQDISFESVYKRISIQSTLSKKLHVLQGLNVSAQDMIDLFENGIFFEDEYIDYYEQCTCMELAVLLFMSKPEEFTFHANIKQSQLKQLPYDTQWEYYLFHYLSTCKHSIWQEFKHVLSTTTFSYVV